MHSSLVSVQSITNLTHFHLTSKFKKDLRVSVNALVQMNILNVQFFSFSLSLVSMSQLFGYYRLPWFIWKRFVTAREVTIIKYLLSYYH